MLSKAKLEQIAKVLEGIPVLGCLQGSPSERAGIRYGDVVLSVNGMKTSDMDLYSKARELRSGRRRKSSFFETVSKSSSS